ncbi:small ribosomal subunit protein bS6m [Periplaneta americana]|uniref:small ribosomal subunit protein bS6m n=1 Tax=Periplaneta americana TaxID=6978 RepID=UPI0037E9AF4A
MPNYEVALVLRAMSRPEIITTLKRSAESIFSKGGIIRKIENLGSGDLPYKMRAHSLVHRQGSCFVVHFICPPTAISVLEDEYGRDVDIVRRTIFKQEVLPEIECTLDEEMQPPAYRKDVQKMIEDSKKVIKKSEKHRFKYNTGLDYYPFQK